MAYDRNQTRKNTELPYEEWVERELEEALVLLGDRPGADGAAHCPVVNTDRVDVNVDQFSAQVLDEDTGNAEKGLVGLVILIFLELVAIGCVGAYWLSLLP